MAYLNSQVTQGQVAGNADSYQGVDCDISDTSARVLFDSIPNWTSSLSGNDYAITYANTANNTGVECASSGTGTIYIDGAYQTSRATGTVVYQGGATWTQSISAVAITNGGLGYFGPDNVVTCTFSNPQSGTNVTTGIPILGDGNIAGVTITNTGSGYAKPGVATVTFSVPPTHYMYLQMKDRTSFKLTVPNSNGTLAVTLTPNGYTAVGPNQARLHNQGQI
jgi:hypothetical protein